MGAFDALPGVTGKVLATVGRTLYLEKEDKGEFSPAAGTHTTWAEMGSPFEFSGSVESYPLRLVDGDIIKSGDIRVTAAGFPEGVTPAVGDNVIEDVSGFTDQWTRLRVVNAMPTYAGDVIAAWDLQLRGA